MILLPLGATSLNQEGRQSLRRNSTQEALRNYWRKIMHNRFWAEFGQ